MSDDRPPHHQQEAGGARGRSIWGGLIVLLLLGLGSYWVYDLAMRDPSEIPVIRALEGPTRTQPDESGGEVASNQGLEVNEVLSGEGTDAAAQNVNLAPEDEGLAQSDAVLEPTATPNAEPPSESEAIDALVAAAVSDDAAADSSDGNESSQEGSSAGSQEGSANAALDSEDGQEATAQDANEQDANEQDANEAGAVETAALESTVIFLARPAPPRPASFSGNQAGNGSDNGSGNGSGNSAPQQQSSTGGDLPSGFNRWSQVAEGTSLIQLGAFGKPEIVASEWTRISAAHADLLAGKTPVIQRIERGGQVFYRLRVVGIGDIGAARGICSALEGRGVACMATTRKN